MGVVTSKAVRVLCSGSVGVLRFIVLIGQHSILVVLHILSQHGQFCSAL